MSRGKIQTVLFFFIVLAFTNCGKRPDSDQAGGITFSSDSAAGLETPSGTLDNNTNISVERGQSRDSFVAYRFSPSGLVFKQPATLKILYPDSIKHKGKLCKGVKKAA